MQQFYTLVFDFYSNIFICSFSSFKEGLNYSIFQTFLHVAERFWRDTVEIFGKGYLVFKISRAK